MSGKTVSVVMAVYNHRPYVSEAIESVLNQTYRKIEVVIVDDASTDGSGEICHRYARRSPDTIRYVQLTSNRGAGHAFRTAMKLATGEYVAAAGSDDIQCPTKIEACIGHMESEPGTDMLFSDYEAIDENGKALGRGFWFPQEINNDNILDYELRRNYLLSGACVMKNVKEIEYDDNLRSSVDYDMFLSLLCKGFKFEYIRERMFKYRLHKANISLRHDKSALSYKYVLSKYRCQDLYPILRGKGIPEGHICNTFGIMCIHRDELSEAERHLLRGLSLNAANGTDLLDSHFYLATVYYASGKLEEAHAHLSEALRLCVREPTVLNNMGVLESRRGRRQAARRLFDEAVRISPLYVDAKCNNERVRAGQCADRFTKDMLRKEVVHSENMNG